MDVAVTAVSAAGGLVIGDGLDLVVRRVGAKESLARPWGMRPFSVRALALAAVGAAVLGAFGARFGADVALAPFAVLALGLLALSAVDLERYLIPNRIVYPTLAVVAPLLVVASAVDHRWGSLGRAAIAGAVAFAGFFAVHLAVPRGMGFGDVRLAGLIGLATGWLGLGHAFVGFFAAFVLGAVIGIGVMVATGGGRKTRIPFGPFLAAGAVVAVVWGSPVAHAIFHHTTG
ncbi:MAG: prepilin peptidase [Acidimicrobiales bacterium]